MQQKIIASKGDLVEVYRVHRNLDDGTIEYEIKLKDLIFRLDSQVLELPEKVTSNDV